jgi:hypothetical protein
VRAACEVIAGDRSMLQLQMQSQTVLTLKRRLTWTDAPMVDAVKLTGTCTGDNDTRNSAFPGPDA